MVLFRYHSLSRSGSSMAINLRLTDEQDEALTALAETEGVSKNEAAVRAILDRSVRLTRNSRVRELARETIAEYDVLLQRLGE